MEAIKPIETLYKGFRCRSRAEARWMVFLDAANIPYVYEGEGYVLPDGTKYLPDFYLPDQDCFLEVKGIMTQEDENKIKALCVAAEKQIIIGLPDLSFYAYVPGYDVQIIDGERIVRDEIVANKETDIQIHKCKKCGKTYFKEMLGCWDCECCGYYDGDGGFDSLFDGHADYQDYYQDYYPLKKAREARFEFGKNG